MERLGIIQIKENMLQIEEKERYNRHLIIPEIGEPGQIKLKNARVLVVGAGGLGCPVLQYLAAAGIGTIGIVDSDVVSLSNLQRQILFTEDEVGMPKASVAADKLRRLNSTVKYNVCQEFLTAENAEGIIAGYDVAIGATDNFPSRYVIDNASKKLGKPFVHGSILEFEGQIAVFNYKGSKSYAELFPEVGDVSKLPIGVMGVLPGIVGSMMAMEAIKIIANVGTPLADKLAIYNALECSLMVLDL